MYSLCLSFPFSPPPRRDSDLSHNLLAGQLEAAPLEHLGALLDLRLAHNQLERLAGNALANLARLQTLDLQANRLVELSRLALNATRASLVELNVAQNELLAELPLPGDTQIRTLWAHSNPSLKRVPLLGQAERLTLTYAYHCCEYLAAPEAGQQELQSETWHLVQEPSPFQQQQQQQQQPSPLDADSSSLIHHLARALFGAPKPEELNATGSGASTAELVVWPRAQVDYVEEEEEPAGEAVQQEAEQFGGVSKMQPQGGRIVIDDGPPPRSLVRPPNYILQAAPKRRPVQCAPRPNVFTPCQDLFDSWWLRLGVWLVFASSFVGNLLVIIVLASARPSSSSSALANLMWLAGHSKRHIDVPRFLVLNLALADLLMALYLGLLAALDLSTRGEFRLHAIRWQHSAGCKVAAFLAVLSSELSVFILAIITLERNYAITNAVHLNRRLSLQKAALLMLLGYTFALAMAVAPLRGISDFRQFALCLPLDFETNAWSRAYVVALISINAFSFALLLSCYLRMYCAIRGSQAWNSNDLKIAKRMSILIVTDFLCWSPIILVAAFALAGHQLVGPRGLKVLTVFVLPLNSVANPFLYAITTKKFHRDLGALKRRLLGLVLCGRLKTASEAKQKQPAREGARGAAAKHKHLLVAHRLPKERRCAWRAGATLLEHQWLSADLQQQQQQKRCQQFHRHKLAPSASGSCAPAPLRWHRGGGGGAGKSEAPKSSLAGLSRRQQALAAQSKSYWRAQTEEEEEEEEEEEDENRLNLVTVNGTTVCCSCGLKQQHPSSYDHFGSSTQARRTQQSRLRLAELERPRIVLESVCEPSLGVAMAPLSLAERVAATSVQMSETSHEREEAKAPPELRQANHADHQQSVIIRALSSGPRQLPPPPLRPSSAFDERAHCERGLGAARLSSCQAILCLHSSHSPQQPKQHSQLEPGSATAVGGNCESEPPPDRCASACAYQWPSSTACTRAGSCNIAPTSGRPALGRGPRSRRRTKQAQQQLGAGHTLGQGNKLSRSISRLLFGPIARACSSIQSISLHSRLSRGAGGIGVAARRLSGSSASSSAPACMNSARQSPADGLWCDCDAPTGASNDLMASKPSHSQRQARRLSRSCDQLLTSTATTTLLQTEPSSTTSADEAALLGVHNQQTLLASVELETSLRCGQGPGAGGLRKGSRCRSWSPALLGKLESCVQNLVGSRTGAESGRKVERTPSSLSSASLVLEEPVADSSPARSSPPLQERRLRWQAAGGRPASSKRALLVLRQQSSANSDTPATCSTLLGSLDFGHTLAQALQASPIGQQQQQMLEEEEEEEGELE